MLFALFVSCSTKSPDEISIPEKTTIITEASTSEKSSVTEKTSQTPLPIYKPDLIELEPDNVISGDFELFKPTKRRLYYQIPGPVIELVPVGTISELFEKNEDIFIENQEMVLVTLIKHCNISKQDFERAVEKVVEQYIAAGADMTKEDNEIPNPDIIYTFDNEIINAYYRRENPVVPDWLTNLQPVPGEATTAE